MFLIVEELQKMPWHRELQKKSLHPSVLIMLKKSAPDNVEELLFQWPHVAEIDNARLAYTRNIRHGEENLQKVTGIERYLRRHWSEAANQVLRDAASRYTEDVFVAFLSRP